MKFLLPMSVVCAFLLACGGNDFERIVLLTRPEQFKVDTALITEYVIDNEIQNVQIEPESGIRYVIHTEGTGDNPIVTDSIRVNFEGKFLENDEIFDEGMNISFELDDPFLIQGWKKGLPLVKEGGSITLYIPSFFAFGNGTQDGEIPPFAVVIFDIDLIEIIN